MVIDNVGVKADETVFSKDELKNYVDYAKAIHVSVEKNGEKYFFQSYSECARFFKKVEHSEEPTTKKYLGQRRKNIFGWQIKYFDEPKPKAEVEHSNKGKKYGRRS